MPVLNPRQKAQHIVALFAAARQTDVLPTEIYPADLDEAYRICDAYEAIKTPRLGAAAGFRARSKAAWRRSSGSARRR